MKNSKKDCYQVNDKKCCDIASLSINNDEAIFSMMTKLENSKNCRCTTNIFKIYNSNKNFQESKANSNEKTNSANIRIIIKNEHNYNYKEFVEPVIMNSRFSPSYKKGSNFSKASNTSLCNNNPTKIGIDSKDIQKKTSHEVLRTYKSDCLKDFSKKRLKYDFEHDNISKSIKNNFQILPRRLIKDSVENNSFCDERLHISNDYNTESILKNKKQSNLSNNNKMSKNTHYKTEKDYEYESNESIKSPFQKNDIFSLINDSYSKPKPAPRTCFNKLIQTDSIVIRKESSLESLNSIINKSTLLPKINCDSMTKTNESSNISIFKSMNSNELGNYIDNVIQQFRLKANLYESDNKINQFDNTIFYPESREEILDTNKYHTIEEEKSNENISDTEKVEISTNKISNENRSFTDLIESRPFSENQLNEELEENTTFINYTHSFEIDDEENSNDDELTYPSSNYVSD